MENQLIGLPYSFLAKVKKKLINHPHCRRYCQTASAFTAISFNDHSSNQDSIRKFPLRKLPPLLKYSCCLISRWPIAKNIWLHSSSRIIERHQRLCFFDFFFFFLTKGNSIHHLSLLGIHQIRHNLNKSMSVLKRNVNDSKSEQLKLIFQKRF